MRQEGEASSWGCSIFWIEAKRAGIYTLQGSRVAMSFFQHRYYKVNRVLMRIIGQWPYQGAIVRWSIVVVICLLSTSQLIPEMLVVVKKHDDWAFLVECISPFIYVSMCGAKLFCCVLNSRKMLNLLNCIRTDWQAWAGDREVNFLHEYAEQGRKMTVVYTVAVYLSCVLFVAQPMLPKVIDVLLMNNSEPGEFPIPVDYYNIDMQKYYFYIILHIFVIISVGHTIVISCDTMFIVYVQHCCGVFAALGHKLERLGTRETSAETREASESLNSTDIDMEHLLSCIIRHNNAIKSAELMEATYSWSFLIIVGLNMFMISVTGFQNLKHIRTYQLRKVDATKSPRSVGKTERSTNPLIWPDKNQKSSTLNIVKRSVDPEEMLRFVSYNMVAVTHLFCETYLSQTLMDHSISIHYSLINVQWYKLSLKAQKLILFMMMRCSKPCKLTAGKISVMCIETFWVIMKTSLSYFTLLRSV